MNKSNYTKLIPEEYLFERYNEVFHMAKARGETMAMALATDRQAALMGVHFHEIEDCEEEDE